MFLQTQREWSGVDVTVQPNGAAPASQRAGISFGSDFLKLRTKSSPIEKVSAKHTRAWSPQKDRKPPESVAWPALRPTGPTAQRWALSPQQPDPGLPGPARLHHGPSRTKLRHAQGTHKHNPYRVLVSF